MKTNNKDTLTISADKLLTLPFVDTSIELTVYGINKANEKEVDDKLKKLYGEKASVIGKNEVTFSALPDFDKPRYSAVDAERVIDRLTRPVDGCPWDRAQTHESIRINMIEEAYEAVDAIDKHDIPNMREEFGDVLLQSLLQSSLAMRAGEFDFNDVCDELCKKLISRHTFIFGGDSAGNPDDAITLWEKNKAVEKHYSSLKEQLERLPDSFPSLLYCQKIHKKTKKAGAPVDPQSELEKAIASRDYTSIIVACVALLSDDGKDAEVELNKLMKEKVKSL